jgi:hypothetical protein
MALEIERRSGLPLTGKALGEGNNHPLRRRHHRRDQRCPFRDLRWLAEFERQPLPGEQDLALRSQIREWQPQLRMLFMTRITLFKYRLQLPGFEQPAAVRVSQLEFDHWLAVTLDRMADRMEDKAPTEDREFTNAFERLANAVRTDCSEASHQSIAIELKTFLALSHTAEGLVVSLGKEVSPLKLRSSTNQL